MPSIKPLTMSLTSMWQTVVGFFVLSRDVRATAPYVLGVALNGVGGLLFTLAKYRQSRFYRPGPGQRADKFNK